MGQHHATFTFINASTAVSRIAKLSRDGRTRLPRGSALASDERYTTLMNVVVQSLPKFKPRNAATTITGLATLQAGCGVPADADVIVQLGEVAESVAPGMNAQEVANTLSAYAKCSTWEMAQSLRAALAEAAERVAPDMIAQNVANTLTAYSRVLDGAAAGMPPSLMAALAKAAERVAPDMDAQNIANTLNAYSRFGAAAEEMSPTMRAALAEAAERTAPDMTAQAVANTLNAIGKAVQVGPGFSQLTTPRLLSGTFRDFQLLKLKSDKPLS